MAKYYEIRPQQTSINHKKKKNGENIPDGKVHHGFYLSFFLFYCFIQSKNSRSCILNLNECIVGLNRRYCIWYGNFFFVITHQL